MRRLNGGVGQASALSNSCAVGHGCGYWLVQEQLAALQEPWQTRSEEGGE